MSPPLNGLFLERLIRFLLPYFTSITPDTSLARAEITETLASYGARTRAELLNVVQVIAFTMSALELLSDAQTIENLSASMRLRFRGCANNLNRSSQQAEKTLAKRLSCDSPEAELAEAEDDMSDLPTEEILRRIDAEVAAARNLAAGARPNPNKRQKGSPMFNALFDGAPPGRSAAA